MTLLLVLLCLGLASAQALPRWAQQWVNITPVVIPPVVPPVISIPPPPTPTLPTFTGPNGVLSALSTAVNPAPSATGCTPSNASNRTEFRQMSLRQRKAFTDAIICLQKTPPQYLTVEDQAKYPGVKSRYDEYIATHSNYTWNIHGTASFFAWHRYYIWRLEQDLHYHCKYTGYLPYWDWRIDAEAPQDSEIFNGDPYSMGSNGAYIANRTNKWLALQDITFPPGTGGGCVTKGPFSNYTVNMGPIDNPFGDNVNNIFDYNPHCLIRDLNPWFGQRYITHQNVTDLMTKYDNISTWQAAAQGGISKDDRFGIHGGGHWVGGGNAALSDFHASPSDPVFFIHHAMMDRLWYIWQHGDLASRQNAIAGTSTLDNNPPSAVMSLNDTLPFGLVSADQRFGDLMSTYDGPFCYQYAS